MITSSSGMNRPSPSATNRDRMAGTFTRANWRPPVVGWRSSTARFSDNPEM